MTAIRESCCIGNEAALPSLDILSCLSIIAYITVIAFINNVSFGDPGVL